MLRGFLFVQRVTKKNVLNFGIVNLISKKLYLSIFLIYIALIMRPVWHLFIYLEVIYISFSIDQTVFRIQRNERLIAVFQTGASGRSI